VIIDRFGKDVPFRPAGEGWFTISVKVAVSVHFFTWIMNFRGGVMLKSPDNVCEEFREFIREANVIYME